MNILNLLDLLEDELETGRQIPLTSKIMISKEKCQDIIRDIRMNLPEELKQAEWIKKERQRILNEAQAEAEELQKETEAHILKLIEQDQITQRAYIQAEEIVEHAQLKSKDIRVGAKEYADGLLEEVESYIAEQLEVIRRNRQELNAGRKNSKK